MKKKPFKLKYTNGKKTNTGAFPFKGSPAKQVEGENISGNVLGGVAVKPDFSNALEKWAAMAGPRGRGRSRAGGKRQAAGGGGSSGGGGSAV